MSRLHIVNTAVAGLPAFPVDALPDPLRCQVASVAEALQVPADLPGMLGLAVLSTAGQRVAIVEPRSGWREPLGTFVVVALPSGERKSPALTAMVAPLRAYERERNAEERGEIKAAEARRKILEREQARAIEAGDRQDAESRARALADCEALKPTRLVADDVTAEALAGLLCDHTTLGVFSAEAGLFQRLAGRYTRGAPDLDVYLQAHAGDAIVVDRRGDGLRQVFEPSLALGLAVQPTTLALLASVEGVADRGLLARFLFALPVSNVGRRRVDTEPLSPVVARDYSDAIARILASGTEDRRVLAFDAEAQADLLELLGAIEPRLAPGADLSVFPGWGSKLAGTVCRVAAAFELLISGPDANLVRREAFRRSRAFVDYWIAHARQAARVMAGDPATALQDPLVAMLVEIAGEGRDWTASELRAELMSRQLEVRLVPRTPRAMRARVDTLRGVLDSLGVDIEDAGHRRLRLSLREGAE